MGLSTWSSPVGALRAFMPPPPVWDLSASRETKAEWFENILTYSKLLHINLVIITRNIIILHLCIPCNSQSLSVVSIGDYSSVMSKISDELFITFPTDSEDRSFLYSGLCKMSLCHHVFMHFCRCTPPPLSHMSDTPHGSTSVPGNGRTGW